jgi:hypothetical protein
MLRANGKWVVGLIMGFDPGPLPDSSLQFENLGLILVFCRIDAYVEGTIPTTTQISDLQMAGFEPVGAVVRDAGEVLLCGRTTNSVRVQTQLVVDAPRIFVEAGVKLDTMLGSTTAR